MQSNKNSAFVKEDVYQIRLTIQLQDAEHMNACMLRFIKLKRSF